jgi:hypothetical protein
MPLLDASRAVLLGTEPAIRAPLPNRLALMRA